MIGEIASRPAHPTINVCEARYCARAPGAHHHAQSAGACAARFLESTGRGSTRRARHRTRLALARAHRRATQTGMTVELAFGYTAWTNENSCHFQRTRRGRRVCAGSLGGLRRSLLMSHDVCQKRPLTSRGGLLRAHQAHGREYRGTRRPADLYPGWVFHAQAVLCWDGGDGGYRARRWLRSDQQAGTTTR